MSELTFQSFRSQQPPSPPNLTHHVRRECRTESYLSRSQSLTSHSYSRTSSKPQETRRSAQRTTPGPLSSSQRSARLLPLPPLPLPSSDWLVHTRHCGRRRGHQPVRHLPTGRGSCCQPKRDEEREKETTRADHHLLPATHRLSISSGHRDRPDQPRPLLEPIGRLRRSQGLRRSSQGCRGGQSKLTLAKAHAPPA
jgi:hypothetical protein